MKGAKIQRNFRLSETAIELVEKTASQRKMTNTELVEWAIAQAALSVPELAQDAINVLLRLHLKSS